MRERKFYADEELQRKFTSNKKRLIFITYKERWFGEFNTNRVKKRRGNSE